MAEGYENIYGELSKIYPVTSQTGCVGISGVSHIGSANNVQKMNSVCYVVCVIVTDSNISQGGTVFTVPYTTRIDGSYVIGRKDDGTTLMLEITGNNVKTPLTAISSGTVLRMSFVYFTSD